MEHKRIDKPAFFTSVAIIIVVCIPLALSPDTAGVFLQNLYDYIAAEFGVLFLLASVGSIGFLVWLAFSRYGEAKLAANGPNLTAPRPPSGLRPTACSTGGSPPGRFTACQRLQSAIRIT